MRCEKGEPSADIFLGQNGRTQERLRFTVQTPDDRSTMLGVTEWSRTNAKVKIRAGKLLNFLATALNGEGFVSNGITGYLMDLDEQSRQRIRTFIGRCRGPAEPWPKIGGQARRPNRNGPGRQHRNQGHGMRRKSASDANAKGDRLRRPTRHFGTATGASPRCGPASGD